MKITSICLLLLVAVSGRALADWNKHVVVENAGSMINSVVANDFDRDGHMDILASYENGVKLLRGPDWKAITIHVFSPESSRNKPRAACIHSCLMDVDGDGAQDFCGSNLTVFWLECPDDPCSGKPWVYRTIDDEILGTHCLITGDVDRDGRVDLIANSFRDTQTKFPNSITWLQTPKRPRSSAPWKRNVFADRDAPGGNHYMGFGDVNKDGRPDIACGAKGGEKFPGGEWFAWWEQPKDPSMPWKKHILAEKQVGATNILPVDLNADGHVDYVASRGHGMGVLWFKGPAFELIEIDPLIARPHCLAVADFDLDGDPDLTTCGSEIDGDVVWYENDGSAGFVRHDVGAEQSSYDVRATDMDGDGDYDLLHAGHKNKNIIWYENPLK